MSYFKFDPSVVSDVVQTALINYFVHRVEPGGFLTAVLAGDLYGAVGRADYWNSKHFCEIVEWIACNAPRGSWGSDDAVCGWLDGNRHFQQFEKEYLLSVLKSHQENQSA